MRGRERCANVDLVPLPCRSTRKKTRPHPAGYDPIAFSKGMQSMRHSLLALGAAMLITALVGCQSNRFANNAPMPGPNDAMTAQSGQLPAQGAVQQAAFSYGGADNSGCADGNCGGGVACGNCGGQGCDACGAAGMCAGCGGRGCGACGHTGLCRHGRGYYPHRGAAGPPTAAVAWPYYSLRGPRDFLRDDPPSIGY
jgi:hypothetical protein